MTKMLSLSSWTIIDPNLILPLVVFIGILMGFLTLGVLSDVVKISKFVEFIYGYVILTYQHRVFKHPRHAKGLMRLFGYL